jgi:F420-non-reducing hydrogenase small subunit
MALLDAEEWIGEFDLGYMTLVMSAYHVPEVEVLLVTGGVRTDEDLYKLRRAVRRAEEVVAVGTCAISGGIANLGNRHEVREVFLAHENRIHLPHLLPKSHPIDTLVEVDRYLPGCPPTPELYMAVLRKESDFKAATSVCQECGRKKPKEMRPTHLLGFQQGEVMPDVCLVNQGYMCIGTSTRGGCRALCTIPGYPCVGCRGPSNAFIEKESEVWFAAIHRVFTHMTDIPEDEVEAALRSPQLSLFLFQVVSLLGVAGE